MFFKLIKYYLQKQRINLQIHYALLTGGGFILGMIKENINPLEINYFKFLLSIIIILIAFYSSLTFNDVYDFEADLKSGKITPLTENIIDRKNYIIYGFFLMSISLILSLLLGFHALFTLFLLHILQIFYSVPPFRFKRLFPISVILLAIAALLSCLFGFSVIEKEKFLTNFPLKLYLIFFLAFPFAMNFRDVLDLKGDKIQGIKTLAVIVGEKKAPLFGGISLFITYLLVALILSKPVFFLLSIIAGILSITFSLRKNYDETPLFIVYFLYLIIFIILIYFNPEYLF